jgi:hypothetical protein
MNGKKPVTILLTEKQVTNLKNESKSTGNSQNSIVRTALDCYFRTKQEGEVHSA